MGWVVNNKNMAPQAHKKGSIKSSWGLNWIKWSKVNDTTTRRKPFIVTIRNKDLMMEMCNKFWKGSKVTSWLNKRLLRPLPWQISMANEIKEKFPSRFWKSWTNGIDSVKYPLLACISWIVTIWWLS